LIAPAHLMNDSAATPDFAGKSRAEKQASSKAAKYTQLHHSLGGEASA